MALDLYVLENEIRKGRISLEQFIDDKLVAEILSNGIIVLNSEKKRYDFEINDLAISARKLVSAIGSKEWKLVQDNVYARDNNGLELRQNNKRNKAAIINIADLEKIKEYAIPVKKEKNLEFLSREAKEYAHSAINDLCSIFNASYQIMPSVKLDQQFSSQYDAKANKILLGTVYPEIVYEMAARFVCEINMPKNQAKSSLDQFFGMAIKEAIVSFCSMLSNPQQDRTISLSKEGYLLATKIMAHDVSYHGAANAAKGEIKDNLLKKVKEHISCKNNCLDLSKGVGLVFGKMLFYSDSLLVARQLLLNKERDYVNDFFTAKRFVYGLETLYENIKNNVHL